MGYLHPAMSFALVSSEMDPSWVIAAWNGIALPPAKGDLSDGLQDAAQAEREML